MASDTCARPSNVRYGVMILATLVAILLYLHRYCLSTADRDIKVELELTEAQMANVLGAFFFAYALCQIPSGFLADRYGPRTMLTFYIIVWSALTGLLGVAQGYVGLLALRLGVGVFEAGAYPACAGIIRRWIPYPQRGLASGIVSLGGRIGGTITPKLTALLMVAFAVWYPVGSWRPVMLIYGLFGIGVAVGFWWIFRDSPREHPACNQAEAELILENDPNPPRHEAAAPVGRLFRGVLGNFSLWMCSLLQFGINFGWVFLITYLNRYLQEVHDVPIETRGTMNTVVIGMSLPALIIGGWWTDRMTKSFGQRWGRCLPMAISRFVSAAAFLAAPFVDDAWTIVLLLGAVAFFSDLGVPAIWAYIMDVGRRNVGFVLGWGNMWGNLGAALSPIALNWLIDWISATPRLLNSHLQSLGNAYAMLPAPVELPLNFPHTVSAWNAVFFTCGAVFALVGIASLFVDATKPVEADGESPPHNDRVAYDDDKTELIAPPPKDDSSTQYRAANDDVTEHVPKPPPDNVG